LLIFLSKNAEIDIDSAIAYLVRLQQIPSQQLAEDVKELASKLGLVSLSEGARNLSSSGRAIVLGPLDDNGVALQRRLLLKIIHKLRRDLLWLAFAKPDEILSELPSVHQILAELKLVGRNPAAEAQQFWADLRIIERKVDDAILKKIGDQAEAWSIQFEKHRLLTAGLENLAKDVIWLSRENDFHGYDILSYSGNMPDISERRHIEVKRCRVAQAGKIDFYLSRNEVTQARALGSKYLFHLWWLDENRAMMAVVPSALVSERLPVDFNESNYWTECRVSVSISELSEKYEQGIDDNSEVFQQQFIPFVEQADMTGMR
jgi:hypothetical protein